MENPIYLSDTIVEAFIESPNEITFYEQHDIQNLERIRDSPTTLTSDKRLLNDTIKRARSYNKDGNQGTIFPTKYEKTTSRYSPKCSLFTLSKDLKYIVYFEYGGYQSYDIVNRNYSIIHEIAKQNNEIFETVKDFVNNYKTYCNEYQVYWGGKDFVKEGFADLVAHPIHKDNETPFIKKLVDELQIIQSRFQHPRLPNINLMEIIEIYATHIIKCVYKFLVGSGIIEKEYCVFGNNVIFFKPLKDFDKEEFLPKIENHILKETNLCIRFH